MRKWDSEEERCAQWDRAAAGLPPAAAELLARLRDEPFSVEFSVEIGADGVWRLLADDCPAWRRTLVFHGAAAGGNRDFYDLRAAELTETENGYALELLEFCEDEREEPYTVTFSGVTVETAFF